MAYSAMLVYMAVSMITPGPNNLTMLYLGAHYGFRGTRKFFTASAICLLLKTLLCGALNLALANIVPVVVDYLKWIGAAYMVYLGFVLARSGWQKGEMTGQQSESTYRSGVILQLLNMKSWVSCLSLYAVYVIPGGASAWTVVWTAVLYTLFMIVSSACWGLFGSALGRFLTKYQKPFGIVMGLALCWCAVTAVL